MREIKFRAWDNSLNSMLEVTKIHEGTAWEGRYFDTLKYKILANPIVMQSTGLKDKNEGDIVNVWFDKAREMETIKVECDNLGSLSISNITKPLYDRMNNKKSYEDVPYDYEVIGNIYENSELLKDN